MTQVLDDAREASWNLAPAQPVRIVLEDAGDDSIARELGDGAAT